MINSRRSEISITRSRATRRPEMTRARPSFFKLKGSNTILTNLTGNLAVVNTQNNEIFESIPILESQDSPIKISYKIVGGYDNNAITVKVDSSLEQADSELATLVYLATFTGFQMKKFSNYNHPEAIFALADEDAYAYCARNPCAECTFRCKQGFELYIFNTKLGMIHKKISELNTNW